MTQFLRKPSWLSSPVVVLVSFSCYLSRCFFSPLDCLESPLTYLTPSYFSMLVWSVAFLSSHSASFLIQSCSGFRMTPFWFFPPLFFCFCFEAAILRCVARVPRNWENSWDLPLKLGMFRNFFSGSLATVSKCRWDPSLAHYRIFARIFS
jgi:hypothetical protein